MINYNTTMMPVTNVSVVPLNKKVDAFWDIPRNCSLRRMGDELREDKFQVHHYDNMYCEVFRDFRRSQIRTKCLEIGFGCGHHVNGISSLIWTSFFRNGGSGVELHEIDLDTPKHVECAAKFLKEHPNIVASLSLGDQGHKPFLHSVINKTGGNFDIVIDDGGHGWWHQRPSFEVLWYQVMPGGLYVIEDLQISNSKEGMVRDILSWMDLLASSTLNSSSIKWTKWPYEVLPREMISVHVQPGIAVMRRKYPPATALHAVTATTSNATFKHNNYWLINQCKLVDHAKTIGDIKFATHPAYGDLYCEVVRDFRRLKANRKVHMLLVGLNCEQATRPETRAQTWTAYFTGKNGPGVVMSGMDSDQNATTRGCIERNTGFMRAAFAGNISDASFIRNVIDKSEGNWDIIIDDGGRDDAALYPQQKATFAALWKALNPGGLYFFEGLERSSSKDGMIREILGWADYLLSPNQNKNHAGGNSTWTDWGTTKPPELQSVHCQRGICAVRKSFTGIRVPV